MTFRKKTKRSSKTKYLDTLFRERIRERDKWCQAPSYGAWGIACDGPLEAAHFIGRGRAYSVRWDDRNAALLCVAHHRYIDSHEADKWEWVLKFLGPEKYAELKEASRQMWDKDHDAVLERLKA